MNSDKFTRKPEWVLSKDKSQIDKIIKDIVKAADNPLMHDSWLDVSMIYTFINTGDPDAPIVELLKHGVEKSPSVDN